MTTTKRIKRAKPDPELLKLADSLLANYTKPEDLIGENGLLKQLTKMLVERALEVEMTDHLGHGKSGEVTNDTANCCWTFNRTHRAWKELCLAASAGRTAGRGIDLATRRPLDGRMAQPLCAGSACGSGPGWRRCEPGRLSGACANTPQTLALNKFGRKELATTLDLSTAGFKSTG